MKKQPIHDERILAERRKIQSTGYAWIVTILLLSIVVQQFFMKAPFAQYAVEMLVLVGCGFYNIFANYNKGIDIWNPAGDSRKKILLNTLVSGLASVILFAFLSGNYEIQDLIPYFITFVVFFSIVRFVMIDINNRKQQKLDAELSDDGIAE